LALGFLTYGSGVSVSVSYNVHKFDLWANNRLRFSNEIRYKLERRFD